MTRFSFTGIEQAPVDPILGLNEHFRRDPNPNKVNLGIGVYLNENGASPVFGAVKRAEGMWLAEEKSKDYLGIAGDAQYGLLTQELLFGKEHPVVTGGRAATMHCPGGTGALRLGAEFIHAQYPRAKVWLSDPTWPNHPGVFAAAGLPIESYPYFDRETHGLDFGRMLEALEAIPEGDAVLIHACCHNPTGADLAPDQWRALAELFSRRALLPFLDCAYQGLGNGLEEDTEGLRIVASAGLSFLVANSYSKNLGLYRERTGGLTLVAANGGEARRLMSQVKLNARANYSNPPAHGGMVMQLVLGDPALRALWIEELKAMRERILEMRRLFVRTVKELGVTRDFGFLEHQRGMFSFSGISKDGVNRLREEFSVYLIENGRINVAGMTRANMPYLCRAIAQVLGG
ncbi:MAG: aspartate/tyrosine/aromatic aminotransferase [SAR324 cluster bacterium]|nr:aspartate/tyrosine/aromatic aminotransferase [SAR324 cluster bacterium]